MVYRGVWGFVGTLSWTTAAVYFVRDVGMSPLQLVLAGTALEVAYFLFEVPTGIVADTYSRKVSVVIAALVSGVAMIGIGVRPAFPTIIAGMALWGFAWTFRSGAEDAWLADELDRERLGAAYQRSAQLARLTGLLGITAAVVLAAVDLQLPIIVAGGTTVVLGVFLLARMPEHGFVRPERNPAHGVLRSARTTMGKGAALVRTTPILLLVLGIFLFTGAFEEGFDRLWEAQLLLQVGLPELGVLGEVGWFGILGAATLLPSIAVAAPTVRRIESLDPARLAKLLLALHGALMICALAFALSASVIPAATAYLATTVLRDLAAPSFATWLNGTVTDSSVRATALSTTSLAGSLGEWTGGPALGFVGTRWSIRAALATGALLLAPTLLLFGRAIRHHGVEPELAGRSTPVGSTAAYAVTPVKSEEQS